MQAALVEMANKYSHVVIPGYTHLQRAQPVFLAHHMLAYVEMLQRDQERLSDALHRANECPLGCGALAGSALPLDREWVAQELGFVDAKGKPRVCQNSMDGVSDRDFVIEFCSAAALLSVHLSRLSEDLILWTSSEFHFISIDDAYTTGSSLMPQKKNPDIAELTRGKSSRIIGDLMGLLTLLKGLPMTYNRDLQEDKEQVFDAMDTIRATVRISTAMINHIRVNEPECQNQAQDPMLLATDLADYLVIKGLPFRHAHHVVGSIIAYAEKAGKPLNKLSLDELRAVYSAFDDEVYNVFRLKEALNRRSMIGAPSARQVKHQIARWKKILVKSGSIDTHASR
jgi:argininosuccinate lyase